MRRRKKKNLYQFLILLLLCIGIGYAALMTDLSINGVADIFNATWDIHFDNLVVNPDSNATVDQAANIDTPTSISYEITLSQPGDFYEFNVDVVNDGTIDGMIESVSSKLNNVEITTLPSYIEYSVTYEDDIAIAPNQLLEAGNSETYKIRVGFKKDINPEDLPATNQTLNFLFTVTYVQADANATQKPQQPVIMPVNGDSDKTTFRSDIYRNNIKIINLDDEINPPANVIESWDIGVAQNGNVMAYITANQDNNTKYDLTIQGDGALYANPDSSYLFYNLRGVDVINNIDVLNTSMVTNMASMFSCIGYNSTVFTLDLGDKFDTSKVTDMSLMFDSTGRNSTVFTLDLGDNFDTSNVTTMISMFDFTGYNSTIFTLDLGDKFDTSKVTDMSLMFDSTGRNSTVFTLDLGDKFDTSNVTNMERMFLYTGYKSTVFTLDLGDKFDTSNVTAMNDMFSCIGYNSTVFTLDLGDKFDTSNVTNMVSMFYQTGYKSTVFTLDLGNKFNTSNVTDMSYMFARTGSSSPVFTLDLGDKFDTSNVTSMQGMFQGTGYNNTVFTLDLGDKFDTSNVTDMGDMFYCTGYFSTVFTLDLGDKFDTSNVTNMTDMFYFVGYVNITLELDLSTFDFSSVTSYTGIFGGMTSSKKIYVGNATAQSWIINNSGNSNLTTANVLIKS